MDDVRNPQADPSADVPLRLHEQAVFVPMRLVMQPGAAIIDVDRPDVVVGRHTECDVRLPLPDVSRRHCRLQFLGGGWQVLDLGSLNGTHVNGEPVTQTALQHGDTLKVGSFTFCVEMIAEKLVRGGHVESIVATLAANRKAS
jgi:pSer/pThr/pTyr-binding forkhead associated (FHA) protein